MNCKIFKKMLYYALLIGLILTSLICLSSCKKSKFKNLISYSFFNSVKNLDPQTASEPEELTVISNIFEGLYKKSLNGGYELGLAEDLKIQNNTTYIFKLKDNIFWRKLKDGESRVKVTAQDFVFAFKRLISPKTNSPFASNYFFIKNAKKINEKKANLSSLGIYANENNQLILELEHPVPNLKELLAATPAMPCNEKFFKSTNGRYGTTKEYVCCNGPFFLNAWNTENSVTKRIKIRVNDEYHLKDNVKIVGVNFTLRSPEEAFNLFKDKEINTAILTSNQLNVLDKNNIKSIPFQNKVVGLIFNQETPIFTDNNFRAALSYSVNKEKIIKNLESNQNIATGLIPNSITIAGQSYNKLKPNTNLCPPYDPETAKKLLNNAKKNIDEKNINLNKYSILVNGRTTQALNNILQTWQKNLKLFLKVDEEQDYEKYINKLENNQFDLALVSIDNKFNTPNSILGTFTPNSKNNYAKYDVETLNKILVSANNKTNLKETVNSYFQAEYIICQQAMFIPITFETEYLAINKKVKDVVFNPANKQFYYAYCQCE